MLDDNIRTAIVEYIDDNADLKDKTILEQLAEGLIEYLWDQGYTIIDKIYLDRLCEKYNLKQPQPAK